MKDTFCSYYTNSANITSYMVSKLELADGDVILEPSAGEGVFIDTLLRTGKRIRIDALDMDHDAIEILEKKYEGSMVTVRETDTLLDSLLDRIVSDGGKYSKIIGNPPYGAWQDYDKRDILKKKYGGHYVKETYTLFLLRCISVLKNHGKLSFIIPDTYLFLNMHLRLRELLFANTRIDEILIFPSKFFPGISFGYSNLSIITLEKCSREEALNNTFHVIQGFRTTEEFSILLDNGEYPSHFREFTFKQRDILLSEQKNLVLAEQNTLKVLYGSPQKLGDVANIVTGLYTGDNLKFIKVANKDIKGAKKYDVVRQNQIFQSTSLYGIPNVDEGYIPYVKSSPKRRYARPNEEWYIRWDHNAISYYNGNQKSRFQNTSYYFRTGIGIPMVKSSSIRAFLMQKRVFDQSVVGIFPKDMSKLYYMLALMNSDPINAFVHAINPTANNSANYIKQIPYLEPSAEILREITEKVCELIKLEEKIEYERADSLHGEINAMVRQVYAM